MPRLARLDDPGVLHHIIIHWIERRAFFRDDFDRENFLERLSILVPDTQTICYAWVFMSNEAALTLSSMMNPHRPAQMIRLRSLRRDKLPDQPPADYPIETYL
jgi:hypothetical protein